MTDDAAARDAFFATLRDTPFRGIWLPSGERPWMVEWLGRTEVVKCERVTRTTWYATADEAIAAVRAAAAGGSTADPRSVTG